MVVLASSRFATAGKPLENQRYLKRAPRALAAIIGTERHQTAHSGTESPEKVPNYVLEVFTAKLRQQNGLSDTLAHALQTKLKRLSGNVPRLAKGSMFTSMRLVFDSTGFSATTCGVGSMTLLTEPRCQVVACGWSVCRPEKHCPFSTIPFR
jgi:hypothetical protein